MKFILYLPFGGKAGPARIGRYSRNHQFDGRLIYDGKPIEVDPFDPQAVADFNKLVTREMELAFELGRRIYPLPPRLEMVLLRETQVEAPVEPAQPTLRRKPGRKPKIDFGALETVPAA